MKALKEYSRDELYELVWTEPMANLAPKLGISDVGLKKRCRAWGIPTPSRGYWAKLQAGQKVQKAPLPETWTVEKKKTRLPQAPEEVRRFTPPVTYDPTLLVAAAKRTYTQLARKRPKTQLAHVSGPGLLTTEVAPENVDRACCLWESLVEALEQAGLKLVPQSESVITDGVEELSLKLVERMSPYERPYDKATDFRWSYSVPPAKVKAFVKTGFLAFQAHDIGTENVRQWKDTPLGPLDDKIEAIAQGLAELLQRKHEIKLEEEEWQRKREEERRLEAIEEQKRMIEKDRREALIERATEFRQAEAIRSLLTRLQALDQDEHLLDEFLAWANGVADRHDPCTAILRRARDGDDPVKPKPWWQRRAS